MAQQRKQQFSLSFLIRVLLGILIVVSIGIFANSVMKYNALLEEQRELEEKLDSYREMKEELQELLNIPDNVIVYLDPENYDQTGKDLLEYRRKIGNFLDRVYSKPL